MRIFLTFLLCTLVTALAAKETRLLHYGDISGNKIVFSYGGDLWKASVDDSLAVRLTSHPGRETRPHFSPDGQWIAFTAEYDGNLDVYVMSVNGGEPQRLTYHPGRDEVVGWTPDGQAVLFVSGREMGMPGPYLYRVGKLGGAPEKVALDRCSWAAYNNTGDKVVFNRRRGDFRNWKRYKGAQAQDVWLADLKENTFRNLTADHPGIDQTPVWVGNEIFFISDRNGGIRNIWSYNPATQKFKQHTRFSDFAIYNLETDGENLIFEHGGSLYTYRPADRRLMRLRISVPAENWLRRPEFINPAKYLGEIDCPEDGHWIIAEARGDLFKIFKKTGKYKNLTNTQGVRERYPVISPDGQRVAYFSDQSGDYQLYVRDVNGENAPEQLTDNLKTYPYHLLWSPDGNRLLFGDKDYRFYIYDLKKKKLIEFDRSHYQKDFEFYWEISEYDWSPDGKWVVYSKVEPNLNSAIYLYSLEQKKVYQLTDGELDNFAPAFDKQYPVIYFLSNRNFKPVLDPSEDNFIISKMTQVCAIRLRENWEFPYKKEEEGERNPAEAGIWKIDLNHIAERVTVLPIEAASYKVLKAGKGQVFAMGKEDFGFPGIEEFFNPGGVKDYKLTGLDITKGEPVTLLDGIGQFWVNAVGNHLVYRSGEKVGVLDLKNLKSYSVGDESVNLAKVEMRLERAKEWLQIFNEVWRFYRDFFYDSNLHGVDWKAIRQKYLPLVEFVTDRNELNQLIGDMVGEICASHMYIFGGDTHTSFRMKRVSTGLLGADIVPDPKTGYYRFQKIYAGKSWDAAYRSPLKAPGIRVKEGDYLLAINGHRLNIHENYLKYLVNTAGKDVKITVASTPEAKDRRTYTVQPLHSERNLRRWEWIKSRREIVKKKSGGRIGYIYMSNMDFEGLAEFEEAWKANKYKEGLILDVRYNGGGFTNYFVLDKLERQLVFGVKTRDFKPMRFPMVVSTAKMVTLINEFTGSDGELFTEHFKARKMGPVVGHRTWGGLIGIINATQTVDGGIAIQPNVGFYNYNNEWIVENHGAEPDSGLAIDILPQDGLRNADPQLDKAIELLLKEIDRAPARLPKTPPFPVKIK